MTNTLIILGNQLFPISYIRKIAPKTIYMREDIGLCSYQLHHKHKIILFLSSMRSYRDELIKQKFNVHYEELKTNKSVTYVSSLKKYLSNSKSQDVTMFEIEDKWFEKEIIDIQKYGIKITFADSPMFLVGKKEFAELCPPKKTTPKYRMTDFYIKQRKKMDLLIEDNKPIGGKWTYDKENRKKIPKKIEIPKSLIHKDTQNTKDVKEIVDNVFKDNHGEVDTFNYPTTRKSALKSLDEFLSTKLEMFGDYEDSVDARSPFWFHSVLSPILNIGLITPEDVISKIRKIKNININSYEGYIRQIIGWREFMRGIYHTDGKEMQNSNFFGHNRKMNSSWYNGSTGIDPLDYTIKNTIKHSYAHHIERLMIQANIMNLCEIHPKNVYKWFMEMYIDSSDWVMTPNVYSMGLYADGGIMATKPYICGSNYIMKMMDFKKGHWCNIMDGLYWRFINKNRDYFKTNARSSMMVTLFDKMNAARKKDILSKAEDFIQENTQKND
ncbi:cryptochrome/photolyase family protein [Gammaproteobacteria bacterium]|nr:cryptochrome/photolyase family protein [Gammaproteobacteria bacterium]